MTQKIKCYSELKKISSFDERFEYLKLIGVVGNETFGFDRYLNQTFYRSREWKRIRNEVLARDFGFDLGVEGYPISSFPIVHHMNPISVEDLNQASPLAFDVEYLITVSSQTHLALHYGDKEKIRKPPVVRTAGDTKFWNSIERR